MRSVMSAATMLNRIDITIWKYRFETMVIGSPPARPMASLVISVSMASSGVIRILMAKMALTPP